MNPPVYSEIARKYRLNLSLLERLFDHPAYTGTLVTEIALHTTCKTLLTENHRSRLHGQCVSTTMPAVSLLL